MYKIPVFKEDCESTSVSSATALHMAHCANKS
jgi:hypothetical protein